MNRLSLLYLLLVSLLMAGCEDESALTNKPSAELSFSTDTVFFDTIFRTVSTATKRLKVYNPQDNAIRISEVQLMGANRSQFRVNIDGQPVDRAEDIEVRANDSLFVFVELTIDQSRSSNPYLVKDSLRFLTNGNNQFVNLTAYGRQVVIHRRETIEQDQTWTPDTAHLIVDAALVDSSSTLTIPAGTNVYATGQSQLFIEGSLKVEGTAEAPVTFEGARPEPDFKGEPGQWQGIRLLPASSNNQIEHAIISEGNVGLQVDSFGDEQELKLRLRSSRISDMANVGLAGFSTTILAQNTIINDCCGNLVAAQDGGTYQFFHCTFMGSTCECTPEGVPLVFENDPEVGRSTLTFSLLNSIAYGFKESAYNVLLPAGGEGEVNPAVQYSLVKVSEQAPELISVITDSTNIRNERPLFNNICENNFALTENSPVLDSGRDIKALNDTLNLGLEKDFRDNKRALDTPDIGAVEFAP